MGTTPKTAENQQSVQHALDLTQHSTASTQNLKLGVQHADGQTTKLDHLNAQNFYWQKILAKQWPSPVSRTQELSSPNLKKKEIENTQKK